MKQEYQNIKQQVKEIVGARLSIDVTLSDDEVKQLIEETILAESHNQYISLSNKRKLSKEIYFAVRKYDILQELLEDNTITEIMVNGKDHIFIEREGKISRYEGCFESTEKLQNVISQIVAKANRVVNESNPVVDARLVGEGDARIHVVYPPVALNGPILTIRRFPDTPIRMKDLLQFQSINKEVAEFLKDLVVAGYNLFISGGTGSGKTTFLNALSHYIPRQERIITIEDSAELQIQNVENLVRLETRNANTKETVPISIRDLIRASLRMRPDRIIVGEIRGAEAVDMMQAFNTGHDGSLCTGHANSARDMLSRLEIMILQGMDIPLPAIRGQIASGIDIIVHLGRLRDRSRKVLSVTEIDGYQNGEIMTHDIFTFHETGESSEGKIEGRLMQTGNLLHQEKLQMRGIAYGLPHISDEATGKNKI